MSAVVSCVWALSHAGENWGRPAGLSEHPNHLALVALIGLGPAIMLSVAATRVWGRSLGVAASLVLAAGVVVSGSRAGLLGIAAALFLAFLLAGGGRRRLRLTAVTGLMVAVALGAATLSNQNAYQRLRNVQSQSVIASDTGRRALLATTITKSSTDRSPVSDSSSRQEATTPTFSSGPRAEYRVRRRTHGGGRCPCRGAVLDLEQETSSRPS